MGLMKGLRRGYFSIASVLQQTQVDLYVDGGYSRKI